MGKAKGKKNSNTPLDNKVSDLIYRLLEEKTLDKKREAAQIPQTDVVEDDQDAFDTIFFAKDLTVSEIFNFCMVKDLSMQRVKKVMLTKTIEKVLAQIVTEEQEEFSTFPEYNEPQGEDELDGTDSNENEMKKKNLMINADSNQMNKSVTNQWGITPAPVPVPAPSTSGTETTDESTQKSNKKRTKDNQTKVKRQKTKEDRSPPTSNLKQLGGMDDVIAQLMELIGLPMLHPEIYLTTGVEPPRGVLLHGPPGCGKTSIANAVAGELKIPFISISAPSVVSGMSGESEKRIRDLFEEAKSLAPCLMFFDEIDAITPKRDGGAQREMERRIVAQLLTSMDELTLENTNGKPVIVIGATNRPDSLDAALRRAGRFDREICLNVPNEVSRLHILRKITQSLKIDGQIDYSQLAKLTPGFVGADLKALTTAAGTCAIKRIFENHNNLLANPQNDTTVSENTEADEDIQMEEDTPLTESENGKEHGNSTPEQTYLKNTANMIDPLPLSVIQKFINNFPDPLTDSQLEQLSIRYEDFLKALPTIQPTAKREGFATVPDVTWANVGALSKIRIELNMAIVQPIKRPELYERVGINAPAGVLLWGPPGCGKTLLAKAVANESRANFISIKGPELLNKYVGESERAIRQVFTRARASVPCVIFFDELDALVPRRDTSLSESSSRVVNTLLTELDGLNDRRGIFVIGATNRPDIIDPAMLRPGRLDKTLFIELPNKEEKLDIIKTVTRSSGTPLAKDIVFENIISDERCRNYSGADLAALVRESSILALKRSFFKTDDIQSVFDNNLDKEFEDLSVGVSEDQILITANDFFKALSMIKPSVSDKDRLKYDKLNKQMGWNDDVRLVTDDNTESSG
ncbi:similar to Saccharomyces cerevisiae YLL034C RIX7 Putative ATPase of the AAA family, required for export of pre-ribosomal large subunits from the nucleus [Maudiozyma barnettii]|uniref:Similar to Saccharomyces cerevisiae YLL034C RIX7 Putative ATPase of the AAA family, required for export of pre-ribosomal large subunits from the nucleus n=1 Tax=Maudiozyma barnettii TaxID=61262 RepID=A0A8H2ZKW7_9SACH|nr:putative AAA family ATPase RIX7 [Kazachstania barnettii]CAB4255577.1 similar to Saccharomyces cerevisiae YLL034C RIX7 Putative ATPase of the AAA family, required for export of pre-ribosomal large subunits from the nucleus [Kazachstania barnettii]CAD1784075.1 similar to Saccharomyces cerevisiae YLL034C RIX7 Putative ATPase of the AAA family, required for export of pre-ribosomal large subunits from the nucleus [Kazachstania barnettii]